MKKVLVTGGAGFIGSHVVDACVAQGLDVVVLDNLSTGERRNVNPKARFVEGDVCDPKAIAEAMKEGVDVVNHHAAQIDVRKSVDDPAFDAETNIVGALRLMQAALDRGVKKVIFASSGGAGYGEPRFYPQTEDHPLDPLSPYGVAKVSFEHYLYYFREVCGVPYAALRYANVYGPRQRKDGEAGVVAIFGGKLLAGEAPVINGDGRQTRDYVFVEDVVRANVAALRDDVSGAFNVGTGVETSVLELFDDLRSICGSSVRASYAPAKKGEQMRSVLDGSRLRSLASLPEPVALRAGLSRTISWMRAEISRRASRIAHL
jgi:UDP-glucose 4-epimerase